MTPEEIHQIVAAFAAEHQGETKHHDFFRALHLEALRGMGFFGSAAVAESGEKGALRFIRNELKKRAVARPIIFDVGANVGDYARTILEIFPTAAVWVFEPSPTAFARLTEVAATAPERCRAFNFGLSDQPGDAKLYADRDGSGLGSLYPRQLGIGGACLTERECVRLETLDQVCRDNGVDHIHLLKLDVEGHEIAALNGAKQMLDRGAVDFIQFEFGGTCIDSRIFMRDIFNLLQGYAVCRVLKDGLYQITRHADADEIFLYQNLLAFRPQ